MKRSVPAGTVLAFVVLAAGAYGYGAGGSKRFATQLSPDRTEAVDFYTATRWQDWSHSGGDLIGYVRFRRVAGDAVLATSAAFELSGEHLVIWNKDTVQVGSTAVYDRAGRRWTIVGP